MNNDQSYRQAFETAKAALIAKGATATQAEKRARKSAKHLHPAHIAAVARRTSHALIRNQRHAALDGVTFNLLNGVQS
jgi:hypothetical protein